VFERLIDEGEYGVTAFYYNPNIRPRQEWSKRLCELEKLVDLINVGEIVVGDGVLDVPQTEWDVEVRPGGRGRPPLQLVVSEYNVSEFEEAALGLEEEPEGGHRCEVCFRLRLMKTAEYAKANGFEVFGTTLTVSPHKNAEMINRIGREIGEQVGIEYLERDWKKDDGYKRSLELCRQYDIYRQNYCGCGLNNK